MAPTQAEAVATLMKGHAKLDALLHRLSDEEMERPATIGGGDWSARDLLAHVAYWEELALEAAAQWLAGEVPAIETVFREKRVDQVNAANQERSSAQSPAEVRERALAAHAALVTLVRDMPEAEWLARPAYKAERRERLGTMLGAITGAPKLPFGHVFAHLPDLEEYVTTLGY